MELNGMFDYKAFRQRFSLKAICLIIGSIQLCILALVTVSLAISEPGTSKNPADYGSKVTSVVTHEWTMNDTLIFAAYTVSVVFLLYGTARNLRIFLVPWMLFNVVNATCILANLLFCLIVPTTIFYPPNIMAMMLFVLTLALLGHIVYCHYRQLQIRELGSAATSPEEDPKSIIDID